MSYAGPVSRAKRAPDAAAIRPAAPRPSGTKRPAAARQQAADSDDHRPALVFAAGVIVGLAMGAGVALLLAPQSGAETRQAIGRKSRRLGRRGHDAWDDLRLEFRRALRQRRSAARARRDAAVVPPEELIVID